MSEGKIIYTFKCNGLELKALHIPLMMDLVPFVTIETVDDDTLRATFTTKNIYDEERARDITNPLIERLTDRLSVFLNAAVERPVFSESDLPKKKGGHRVSSSVGLDAIIRVVNKPDEEKRNAIISFLKNPPVSNDLLLSEFAFSLNQSDHLSKYMLFYNLILQICGDLQKSVDETIKKYDPSVTVIKSKRKNSHNKIIEVEETIYTKLRNEIAHKRENVDKKETTKEIRDNLSQFTKIVKMVVLDQKS